jgi:DNA-binding GntR family transcriptional regulator
MSEQPDLQESLDGKGVNPTNARSAYDTLKQAIVSGRLEPGAVISQNGLLHDLSFSRTPLREAVRMLQAEGWLESEPNKRVRVTSMSVGDLEQLYSARIALEALAVGIAASRASADDLARLRGLLDEMSAAVEVHDYDAWAISHSKFHRSLTHGAGAAISQMCSSLSDSTQRYINMHMKDMRLAYVLGEAEHSAIYEAFEAGDSLVVSSLIAKHLARTAIQLVAILDPGREPSPIRTAVKLIGDPQIDTPPEKSRNRL